MAERKSPFPGGTKTGFWGEERFWRLLESGIWAGSGLSVEDQAIFYQLFLNHGDKEK